jgi:hypothetical protein
MRLLWRRFERAWRLLAACALFACAGWAHADQVTEISQLVAERAEEGVLLSATLRLELPQIIDDALQKGIPMYFVADAVVSRDRWYWYDKEIASAARHMRLSYQPLTRRWRLLVSPSPIGNSGLALGQGFDSRDEALAAVRRIAHWKIAEANEVESEARYSVNFRFRMDLSQLPRPFQIGAVGQSEWDISARGNVRLVPESAR